MSLIIKKNTTFKIPRTGSGAPTTLPLSTLSLHISGAGSGAGAYLKVPTAIWWQFDDYLISGNVYNLAFNFGVRTNNIWELYLTDSADNDTVLSTNLSSGSEIPLTGWSSSITITTP